MAFIELTVVYHRNDKTTESKELFNSSYIINIYDSQDNGTRMIYNTVQCSENIEIKENISDVFKMLKACK